MTIRRLNAMALLTGLSLILFVIEMQVPRRCRSPA